MKAMIRIIKKVVLTCFYYLFFVFIHILYSRSKKGELSYLSRDDYLTWKKSMLRMLKEYWLCGRRFSTVEIVLFFAKTRIEIIKSQPIVATEEPVVVLCVKNDLRRVCMLVEHYRALGVKSFAILDNGSDDGTLEWLQQQPDIDLYRCRDQYRSLRKEAWINRIISRYGFNRWYIVTDSDELVVYQGMEDHSLSDVTRMLQKHGIKRAKGLTLDTYPSSSVFEESEDIDIKDAYSMIDTDSYIETEAYAGREKIIQYIGGPRLRLMGSAVPLSKYPLVYWERGTVSDHAHYQYPHGLINSAPCCLGILHYKFLGNDLKEYEKRARKEAGFAGGGVYYKQYLDYFRNTDDRCLVYDGSTKFVSSEVLHRIPFIKPIDFT